MTEKPSCCDVCKRAADEPQGADLPGLLPVALVPLEDPFKPRERMCHRWLWLCSACAGHLMHHLANHLSPPVTNRIVDEMIDLAQGRESEAAKAIRLERLRRNDELMAESAARTERMKEGAA